MKVWQKNFLITLALFTVLFFICIYIVDTISFSTAIGSERETALREETLLSGVLQREIQSIETRDNYLGGVTSLTASFAATYRKKDIYLKLGNGGNIIYNNAPAVIDNAEMISGSRVCKIAVSDGKKFVCVYDTLYSSKTSGYSFMYLKDISAIYDSLTNQSLVLNSIGAATSLLFALLLYLALKSIYKPVDNLAHELRTPLTAIRGYAEYLQNAAATEEDRYSAADFIIGESKRLSDVCDRLLIIANLREGDIVFGELDIENIFENAKMTFKNVEYEIGDHYIKGDKALVQSMINNFVSNAIKASPADGTVRLLCCGNVIEVCDQGKGMDSETLSRISKDNYRPDIIDRQASGNGLGLPLCHQIARLHNARLEFISEEGEGTTVRVTFTGS